MRTSFVGKDARDRRYAGATKAWAIRGPHGAWHLVGTDRGRDHDGQVTAAWVAAPELRAIYRCRDRDQAAARLYDWTVTCIDSHVPELRRLARSGRDHRGTPADAMVGQRVIEPAGPATRIPLCSGTRLWQSYPVYAEGKCHSTNRAEAPTASYYQGRFAAHGPGLRWHVTRLNRGSRRNIETVMPIEYEVERDIVEYLGAHYSIEPDEITDESTLDDLGVDSLGVLAIADIVENKYGISLDDERIAGVRTLSDFKDLIVLKIAEMA